MKYVVLIRHGATEGNVQKRYIGRTDEPLCPHGQVQAACLAGVEADRIVVSPMLRARQTADLAFPGREYEIAEDLRETDFGEFEGKTADEMGKYIADLCRNSPSHWSYVGSSKFSYIGIGVDYRAGTAYGWYGCVMVGRTNYG